MGSEQPSFSVDFLSGVLPVTETETVPPLALDDDIDWLGFDTRLTNTLKRAGIETIGDLTKLCACGVIDLRDIGFKYLCVIVDQLNEHKFKLSNCRRLNDN